MHYAGLDWLRVLPEAELPIGGQRMIERDDLDILLVRTARAIYALCNACPTFTCLSMTARAT
jgi:nitrite reductase/ring-hydroxylating ferredoxin subunit